MSTLLSEINCCFFPFITGNDALRESGVWRHLKISIIVAATTPDSSQSTFSSRSDVCDFQKNCTFSVNWLQQATQLYWLGD